MSDDRKDQGMDERRQAGISPEAREGADASGTEQTGQPAGQPSPAADGKGETPAAKTGDPGKAKTDAESTGASGKAEASGDGAQPASGAKEEPPAASKADAGSDGEKKAPIRKTAEGGAEKPAAARRPVPAAPGRARPAGPAARGTAAKKEEKPEEPSPKQPLLDKFVAIVKEKVDANAVEESFINRPSGHVPVMVIRKEDWLRTVTLMRDDPELSFDYLRLMSSIDQQTHLEVVVMLHSFQHGHQVMLKTKTDREEAVLPSISGVFKGADWNEREIWDLMGIRFDGHPDLRRILLPEDWVGHPLRKDYEPLDQGV
ncbi:NADH-quinone oxidoreductase subunit C [Staphylospora marina]|uniref:NADH-quinone oxidoreductase subunit C n=1 Tax=Staphylospora marina TaxID=2490858 RepID=UPI000F5BFEF6|nr:NADH-quinone oxidoreductase subunit C [Staphylospora marina]